MTSRIANQKAKIKRVECKKRKIIFFKTWRRLWIATCRQHDLSSRAFYMQASFLCFIVLHFYRFSTLNCLIWKQQNKKRDWKVFKMFSKKKCMFWMKISFCYAAWNWFDPESPELLIKMIEKNCEQWKSIMAAKSCWADWQRFEFPMKNEEIILLKYHVSVVYRVYRVIYQQTSLNCQVLRKSSKYSWLSPKFTKKFHSKYSQNWNDFVQILLF